MDKDRVLGFDFLRGLCAVGVASYHVLHWGQLAELRALGLYGVYIFFLLSGASMYIAYAERLQRGYDLRAFVAQRFVRLAPLLGLAMLAGPFFLHYHFQAYDAQFWQAAFFNITFAPGLANPGLSSLVTGGWSLGIEFLFYLVFPVIAAFLAGSMRAAFAVALFALVVQIMFVRGQVTAAGEFKAWGEYTEMAAFIGYFVVGCLIGKAKLRAPAAGGHRGVQLLLWGGSALLFALLLGANGNAAASPLIGKRGIALLLAACLLVAAAAYLRFPSWAKGIAASLGHASYGVYLLHPLVYAALAHHFDALVKARPLAFCALVVAVAVALALVLERLYERPAIAAGRRLVARLLGTASPAAAVPSPIPAAGAAGAAS